ncbi:hypothetical protein [Microcoleus sp. Pol12B4]|uniref:hypothetical protein n=1 Tax=Microcoleus sp. Pol12B4 TaxID=3055395 RepID=UPI002FD3E8F0
MVIRIWGNVLDLNREPLTFAAKLEIGGRRQEAGDRRQEPEEVFLQIGDARSQRAIKIKYRSNSQSYFEKLTINLLGAG